MMSSDFTTVILVILHVYTNNSIVLCYEAIVLSSDGEAAFISGTLQPICNIPIEYTIISILKCNQIIDIRGVPSDNISSIYVLNQLIR